MNGANVTGTVANTSHRVVIPFYIYAAISFLVATLLLVFSTPAFEQHYFHPHTLAITHIMALGWGTMIILGASHQLVPVLTERKLFSDTLAFLSFLLAAIGIPLLIYAFYVFDIGWPARWGGILVNAAILLYLVNLAMSMSKAKHENVQSVFVFTAACWLLVTTVLGLLLVYNFSFLFLPRDSLHYLPLHAHLGIVGWFLLLIIGVGSRLIPMFMISKYENTKLLWWIYACINAGLGGFFVGFIFFRSPVFLLPVLLVLMGLILFAVYIIRSFQQRIRRKIDKPMKISLLSVLMITLPLIVLMAILFYSWAWDNNARLILSYGFTIFFGWLTAIILGMTFKTLPFIAWNKVYLHRSGLGKTPDPKDLFNAKIFAVMAVIYLIGFLLFLGGILFSNELALKSAAILLLGAAVLYNFNVCKVVAHKPAS